jgi:hypothetical protein
VNPSYSKNILETAVKGAARARNVPRHQLGRSHGEERRFDLTASKLLGKKI